MPTAVQRYCQQLGCLALVREGFCPTHERQAQRLYDDRRGSAHSRGYGARWGHYRQTFRALYPLCGMRPPGAPETADSRCAAAGRVEPMYVVDHIVPVTGPDDPTFDDPRNHQALCERCHNAKRQREARR